MSCQTKAPPPARKKLEIQHHRSPLLQSDPIMPLSSIALHMESKCGMREGALLSATVSLDKTENREANDTLDSARPVLHLAKRATPSFTFPHSQNVLFFFFLPAIAHPAPGADRRIFPTSDIYLPLVARSAALNSTNERADFCYAASLSTSEKAPPGEQRPRPASSKPAAHQSFQS
jgi:hypothetical protein